MSSKGRPYKTIRFEGWEILVGRSDEDNDYLTFEVGEPFDLWLHVAGGTAGSESGGEAGGAADDRRPPPLLVPHPTLVRPALLPDP